MLDDLRLSARAMVRAKGLAAAAVICLALGIGGATVVYSVTAALVLHPVPTPDPTGLVMVGEVAPARPGPDDAFMSPANYVDLAQRNRSFSELAAFRELDASLTGIDQPERVSGFRVTPSYFHLLRVRPAMGRVFTDDDARYTDSPNVVIISDGLWRRRFAADPGILGRVVRINDLPRTIVGVMPADFIFPPGAELWTPLSVDGAFGRERDGRVLRGVLARLRPDVSLGRASADVHNIMLQLQREYPEDDAKWDMRVEWANAFYGQHPRPFMLAQLAAVALVLLIACANVANLLLARATTHAREIAVRIALGASRGRIVRQQLAESLLLSCVGGVLGTLLAVWGIAAVRTMLPVEQARFNPGWTRMELNAGVLAFTAAISVITALIVGVVPALVASSADPQQALSEGGRSLSPSRSRHQLRGLLVSAEIALALTMLAGTVVTVRGFLALANEAPGYRVDHAVTMQLTAPIARYATTADAEAMYDRVLSAVRAEPGVSNAAFTMLLPPEWEEHRSRIFLEGEPRPTRSEPARSPRWQMVTPDYFATMSIPLVSGRLFTVHDDSTSPSVIVVSESLARAYWPGRDPLGMRIGCACNDTTMSTVIGVVGDVRFNPNVGPAAAPTYYVPVAQAHPWRTMSLVVRTNEDPAAMMPRIERAIASVAPTVAPGSVFTLDYLHGMSLSPQRLTSQMMAAFAVVALLLAALGIHGVMSYTVAQRTHEIGVRTALGAQSSDILRGVLGGSMRFVVIGIAIGLVGAVLMTHTLAHLLTQLSPNDPVALGAAVVVLACAALAGSYLPARRATRVDPAIALRRDA
ncbi:MAG TPA: ABC transporter permease [Gemmatimonadaceae bacterium]|nr:ABC transporter permease [Gemmatimonadaceae bacterium]